jgi:hypothetical protein
MLGGFLRVSGASGASGEWIISRGVDGLLAGSFSAPFANVHNPNITHRDMSTRYPESAFGFPEEKQYSLDTKLLVGDI